MSNRDLFQKGDRRNRQRKGHRRSIKTRLCQLRARCVSNFLAGATLLLLCASALMSLFRRVYFNHRRHYLILNPMIIEGGCLS